MDHGICICGTPTRLAATNRPCRWDKTNWDGAKWVGTPAPLQLTWALDGLSEQFVESIEWAWDEWMKVCAIEVAQVTNPRDAMIRYTGKRIDGRSGTLAWAQLPCGSDRQLETRMDLADAWFLDPESAPSGGRIHAGAVACHEAGHLLGLEHEQDPQTQSLLDPMYVPHIRTPQQWDIAQVVLRYGPRLTTPNPKPDPPLPQDVPLSLTIGTQTFRGRVTEVP